MSNSADILIGKIIRSESHILYWIQIDNEVEDRAAPSPQDCAFGNYVRIELSKARDTTVVGLITDTMLIDRDALRAGPRLAQDVQAQQMLYPDFIDERIKLVQVLLIGYVDEKDQPHHDFPDMAPHLGDNVFKMNQNDIIDFHKINSEYKVGYYSAGIGAPGTLIVPLFLRVLRKLTEFFPPEKKAILQLMRRNLEFKTKLERGF